MDLRVDDLADRDPPLSTSRPVRSLNRNVRRWQYAVALKARIPSTLHFYHRGRIANSTQLR
jgi:hypothetical protein